MARYGCHSYEILVMSKGKGNRVIRLERRVSAESPEEVFKTLPIKKRPYRGVRQVGKKTMHRWPEQA